ncbi:hypothetical protein E4U42_000018 [Claviceps africana]|uniref:Uncharacterized protein n=1 Tax=Claviceps africana TaxID=83212 RepID=A0A8K0JDV4_9HYPO|nr:hypothetical protein E4U42_000018 [Claviceps africana]
MSQSPVTPRHSRHSSTVENPQGHSADNRQSKSSGQDAAAPLLNSLGHQDHLELGALNAGGPSPSQGMGNLADELADAFSDSDEEDEGEVETGQERGSDTPPPRQTHNSDTNGAAGGGEDMTWTPTKDKGRNQKLLSPRKRDSRSTAADYDGSEYGSESDLDCAGMPATLVAKIDGIESLARRGTENYGGADDDVFQRVTDGLRDLGSQVTVEGNASRLITAHTALATHLVHQTRQLHGLAFPLLSPLVPAPDGETIEDLIPLLVSLSGQMPRPSTFAFSSINALHAITSDLIQTLSYLSDTLQMSRQTTAMATRRLKSAKELVSEIRRDEELREEGERWLHRGNWSQRLARRECASVCVEVIDGFEDVCNGWRQRLLAQAESQVCYPGVS